MEEETVKVDEETVTEAKEEMKAEEVGIEEGKPSVEESEAKSSVNAEDIGDVKEPHEEEDRGERLELEDEPEYEVEEETAVDYGEQEVEHGEQELVEEAAEEDGEGDIGDEEEAEVADQEMDDGGEDAEGEEYVDGEEEENEVDGEGQEHHEVVKEHRKRKEFEIFVGGLDKDATEDDLRKVFSAIGEITEVRLMMNPLTKKNKGFAFLHFAAVEQAKRAVSELKTPVVNGKQCGVAPCRDSDTLFVGNICKTWTKEHLKEKLKNFGIENLEDLSLVEDTNSDGMNRGFAFLEFSSRSEAMEAFRRLQRRDVFLGTERNAKVSFADSFIEPDDEIMAQVKTIFIDGLPATWDEDRVKDYLKKYGLVESIELARNMPSAKRKDFGFVTFDTHDNAVTCAEAINNKELGEGDHKVKVRARLSRPHQKGTGNRDNWGESRIGRGFSRGGRISYSRPPPHRFPGRGIRPIFSTRGALTGGRGFKRPIPFRGKRPFMAVDERPRRLPPPERSYDRRPPVPVYPKSSTRREHSRRDEPPPRNRAVTEYPPRIPIERRSAYRDEYSDIPPRSDPRGPDRRAYVEDGYGRKPERPPPTYREGPSRNYDSFSGSKRPYSELDDVPPRYVDVSMRHSRARLEYGVGGSSAQYDDAYGDRFGPSHMGYGSGRSSLSAQDGLYSSRQGMSYGRGSASGRDVGGMYSSSYSSNYPPQEYDVGGSSYSSLYSGRSSSGNGYLGGRGSGSYY
ncbi:heterogeneous nuclear ribonucleoprotein R [Asparagus officinalis]|nr:heterogeneous nuclear ribonucleoprotein R [Asparagus officinalis]XP_020262933.1 heterogeneous nuclear ribonucleoprotein R [Asparagus officinalis]XP_020262934.1 heterogeneous nuclear ribonucleoprotein R [Asparagus officinalis]XP_020262935.1 heterogeneous nuclear ribonucleoprotein R [Asparagus officinalis]